MSGRRFAAPLAPVALFIACVATALCAVACSVEPRVATADEKTGGVQGIFEPRESGVFVVLCRGTEASTSCLVQTDYADTTNRAGEFAISRVPPGWYVLAYVMPRDLVNGRPSLKSGSELPFGHGPAQFEAKSKDGAWRTEQDTESGTHLIRAGASLRFAASGLRLENASIQHKESRVWMELRDLFSYVDVTVEAGKVVSVSVARWR